MVHGHVGFIGAVHAQHPQRLRVRRRESAQPHQGGGHRQLQLFHQFAQLWFALRIDRPAADVDDRLARRHQGLQGAFNLAFMAAGRRVIRAHADRVWPDVRQFLRRIEYILRQIDHHRPGATAGR